MSPTTLTQSAYLEPMRTQACLPRLLYVGDVAVEGTAAGSALLYRLLQNYPAEYLHIVEGSIWKSKTSSRLPNVRYDVFHDGSHRLLHTRLNKFYAAWLFLIAGLRLNALLSLVREFKPEAILTVTHGYSWISASYLAEHLKLPLHLVCHDDWNTVNSLPSSMKRIGERYFRKVYRSAQSRLCVSPYMAENYERQYGVTGRVLYPSRATDVPEFECPADISTSPRRPLTFAYAGSIYSDGYAVLLASLATILYTRNCQLLIYSALTDQAIKRYNFEKENIIIRQPIPSNKLITTLREEADVLFVPMDFDVANKTNMEMSFPSKLTDYTSVGLPLFICGPPYCSAVRWAQENPGIADVISEFNLKTIAEAVSRLESSAYRFSLASNALAKGHEFFSHSKVFSLFYDALTT
jgi:hypothetical protein